MSWTPSTLPGRDGDKPLFWLRARLTSGGFPVAPALGSVTVNGVSVRAMRTVRGEVAEPIERPASGRSRYRLSQVPVIPGSVLLDIADTATDPFGVEGDVSARWNEVASLATASPDARAFTLDPATGVLTFGDGRAGRAIPAGYRNVVARSYATGASGQAPPKVGDTLAPDRSVPGLTGATVLSLSAASPAESPTQLLARGPATVRSRGRAVAPTDYATAALDTASGGVARARLPRGARCPHFGCGGTRHGHGVGGAPGHRPEHAADPDRRAPRCGRRRPRAGGRGSPAPPW